MTMLIKNASDPLWVWEGKHVIAVRGRPIGNGHSNVMAGYQAAHPDQEEGCRRGENREAVQPNAIDGLSRQLSEKPTAAVHARTAAAAC